MTSNQPLTKSDSTELSRRGFLVWLGGLGLLGAAWQTGQAVLQFLMPPLTQPQPQPVLAGPPVDFAPDTLTFVPDAAAWLGRDAAGFYAISAICTHLGCTVRPAAAQLECPCHGSRFTSRGEVLNGPAAAPLSFWAVRLDEDQLVIDITQAVSADTRLAV